MANTFWRANNPILWICVAFTGVLAAAIASSQKKERYHEEFATSDTRMLTKIRNDYDKKAAMYLPRRVGNPEPWQMTQEQFIEESLKHIKHPPKRHALKLAHAEYIAGAIKAGKKIPDHVMKDYSDDKLYKFYPPWRNKKNPEKQSWEKTRDKYIEEAVAKRPPMTLTAFGGPEYADWESRFWYSGAHAEAVARALKEGKKVPAEVLAYYLEHPLTESSFPWANNNPRSRRGRYTFEHGRWMLEVAAEDKMREVATSVEPWTMTQREYVALITKKLKEAAVTIGTQTGKKYFNKALLSRADSADFKRRLEITHYGSVKEALAHGKKVAPAVLADYSDLKKNPGKQPWEMTRSEFRGSNLTGTIPDSAYRGMTTPERVSEGINKNEYGTVVTRKIFGNKIIEIRKGSSGFPSTFKEIAAFDGDKRVGYAVNEYGATAVFVADNYQKLGIGTVLLDEFQKQFPNREIGQVTTAGYNLVGSYHKQLVQRAVSEGKPVPAPVLDDYSDLKKNPGKQPWEMTRAEWLIDVAHYWKENNINQGRKLDWMIGMDMQAALHKLLVKDAIQEGKPVPAAVLKDYPKLIPVPGKRKEEWQMTKTEYADAMIMKGQEMMKRAEKYRRKSTPGNFNLFDKQGQMINEKAAYLIQGGLAIKKPSQPPYANDWGNPHKMVVEAALMKGKPVPAEVLKDYPELIGKY
jgi:GNAT superfamily N-acetyltransferase